MDLLSELHIYRLRLLIGCSRYYRAGDTTLQGLVKRGLVERTGRADRFGREEWAINVAGREAVAKVRSFPRSISSRQSPSTAEP